jgi:citrate lyase subunit beta/citryl-CoA lyase
MPPLIRRSNLLVTVTDGAVVADCWRHQADAITLDLAQGVAAGRKSEARTLLSDVIPLAAKGGAEVFVRVNRAFAFADIEAAAGPRLSGVMLPGVESAEEITEISQFLSQVERSKGLVGGSLQIIVLIESALGIWNVRDVIGADPRVTQVGLDENALSASMGIHPNPEVDPHVYDRGRITIEATALGVQPIGVAYPLGVQPRPMGLDEMLKVATDSKNLGFKGVLCSHPSWVAPVNTAFTPTASQVDYYTQVRNVFAQGVAAGTAAVPFAGRMIDVPVDEWAKVVLEMAEACHRRERQKQEALSNA